MSVRYKSPLCYRVPFWAIACSLTFIAIATMQSSQLFAQETAKSGVESALESGPASKTSVQESEKWIDLFNGKNLDGWTVKICGHPIGENYANTFRVEDGILKLMHDL